jgi:coproporphyrinogen III oxidase-like Fe-S oxidoreductase
MNALEEPRTQAGQADVESASTDHADATCSCCEPTLARVEARPWLDAGRRLTVDQAWAQLQRVHGERAPGRPYCVYVHIPFCASICAFCALYTKAVNASADTVFDGFVDALVRGIRGHPAAGCRRPPTTVHFGGGTPLHIGMSRLAKLVQALRDAFGNAATCEWAIEITTASVDAHTLDELWRLGFRRVHLGVQTLDERIRQANRIAGRADDVVARVAAVAEHGFLTSVDLITGFEGEQGGSLCADALRLHAVGSKMFSVCELRHRKPAALPGTNKSRQILAALALEGWLEFWDLMHALGLQPIHHGQFGRSQADNLYYTHPARGEDCVAIGPYANGSAASVWYANLLLPDYIAAVQARRPPIAQARDFGAQFQLLKHVERELLAHELQASTCAAAVAQHPWLQDCISEWQALGLLRWHVVPQAHTLTATGSWYVGNMIMQMRARAEGSA